MVIQMELAFLARAIKFSKGENPLSKPNQTSNMSDDDAYYEATINRIATEARREKTTVEKLLYVYNELGKLIEYEDRGEKWRVSHTGKGAIVNGKAFCDGYSEAIIAVLEKLNIQAHEVVSWPMNHSWVMVNIDGTYYHMDLTWDDAGNTVTYDYFQLSDQEMIKANHYGWKTNVKAPSDKYLFIKELFPDYRKKAPIHFENGFFYYLNKTSFLNDPNNGIIVKLAFNQNTTEVIPHSKFDRVYSYKDWYYGVSTDYQTNQTTLYKFKLNGEEKILTSFQGYLSGLDFYDGYLKVHVQGEKKERIIKN